MAGVADFATALGLELDVALTTSTNAQISTYSIRNNITSISMYQNSVYMYKQCIIERKFFKKN
jgi:hypothetical protein